MRLPAVKSAKVAADASDAPSSHDPVIDHESDGGNGATNGGAGGEGKVGVYDLEAAPHENRGPISAGPSTSSMSNARAEAAEARVAELEARVEELEAAAERMDEFECRLNELEKAKQKKFASLLSPFTQSTSTRAKLMSVQTVLFGLTFMMSTFETGNR